jgi:uncharacterized protein YuzE
MHFPIPHFSRKGEAMVFHYYPETDSLYIELSDNPSADSREVTPGVVLDFDRENQLVGIDLDHASRFVNLSRIEAISLPLSNFALAG